MDMCSDNNWFWPLFASENTIFAMKCMYGCQFSGYFVLVNWSRQN